jgi:hypothetical protein
MVYMQFTYLAESGPLLQQGQYFVATFLSGNIYRLLSFLRYEIVEVIVKQSSLTYNRFDLNFKFIGLLTLREYITCS